MYDSRVGKFLSVDAWASQYPHQSPYVGLDNNPISKIDPTGNGTEDWVQGSDGSLRWDKDANSQATTKTGEKYVGKDLSFTFNSKINNSFDGPRLPWDVTGDKLTSTINIKSYEDAAGNLLRVDVKSNPEIKETAGFSIFKGRNYFPDLDDSQNKSINLTGVRSFSATYEQHASVPVVEAFGLNLLGYDIVNVAQKLTIGLTGTKLSITAATDIFPSATLSVNGIQLFKYNQPSFKATHGRDNKTSFGDNGTGGGIINESTPRRPAPAFYDRYKK